MVKRTRDEVLNESVNGPDNNNSAVSTHSDVDLSRVVNESREALQAEPKNRKRRTKAELEAAGIPQSGRAGSTSYAGASGPHPQSNAIGRDRTNELKPAIKLYSKIFLADQIGVPALAFDDLESEQLAKVTSDLMNAFPEYFNSTNPKVAACINVALIALPLGYVKYTIYAEAKKIQSLPEVKNEAVMKQPQYQSAPLNGSAKNEADILNGLASGELPLAAF